MSAKLERIKKRPLTVQIETTLLARIRAEAEKRDVTLRQIVEYSLRKFLESEEKS